ncbi:pyrroline 5-carboyxlate reductase [Leptinotarsa decemlineata]|uniref:pyrroline 5-carboyxlate reductase n=1 Tax=Leptinotarsa decemlineata TaxID=7539 RepID=UPI000C254C84|nr:pyrroline-5-carboxylate reductase [Leptinotarsa decemlineata]
MEKIEISSKSISEKIGFIGGGNMAKAICEGIVNKGLLKYDQVYVSGPNLNNLSVWKEKGAQIFTENGKVVEHADVIFLAVKPHILPTAIANMFDTLNENSLNSKLFISILAGTPIEKLENVLSKLHGSRVIRVMPNTPMMVGEGCTVFSPGQRATDRDIELVRTLLSVTGVCKEVPESLINAVGALSGSGPAFVYLMIEALADGGVKMGISRQLAIEFAAQTVLGAAKMVKESGKHTGQLKDEVCSPGGTTITGIHALERGGVRAAFMDAIECATKKSIEMSEKRH